MWRDQLHEFAAQLSSTDYGSREAVREHNSTADKLRSLVRRVGCSSTEDLNELLSYLSDEHLRGWIAYGVLDQCPTTQAQRNLCVAVIRELARTDDVGSLAAQLWLKENEKIS